jgi:hypothetical protein
MRIMLSKIHIVSLAVFNGNILIAPSALGADGESFSTNELSTITNTSPTKGYDQNKNSMSHSNSSPL